MKNIYIVLGHYLYKNTKISNILKKRLNKCIEKATINDIIIVAGGNPAKQKHTEAYMMKKYILQHLNNKNIILENKSNTTIENFININKILKLINMKKINNINVITSKFHMPKAKRISKKYNYNFKFIEV
tara:strand:+ start:321 stop:710 length:390 start_codon:yes stop_codon:yes gene_type:complete